MDIRNGIDDYHFYLNRSILYSIKPLVFLGMTESLTSYICRLAELHAIKVGDLLTDILFVEVNKQYLLNSSEKGGNRFYDASSSLNSLDANSKMFANALSQLTQREDLNILNLGDLCEILPNRFLIRKYQAYCPSCLEEMKNINQIYYPLVWSLRAYGVCTCHKSKLIDYCFICKKRIPPLHRNARLGYCPYCLNFLEAREKRITETDDFYKSKLVNDFIQKVQFDKKLKTRMNRENISISFCKILDIMQISIDHLSRIIDFPSSTIREWVNGGSRPPLVKVVDCSYKLGIDLVQFFTGDICEVKINHIKQDRLNKRTTKSVISTQQLDVYTTLLNEAKSDDPQSMQQVALKIGKNKRLLYKHYPDICKQISSNYLQMIKVNSERRKAKLKEKINAAVKELLKEGIKVTRRAVEDKIGNKSLFREKEILNFYRELLNELNIKGRV